MGAPRTHKYPVREVRTNSLSKQYGESARIYTNVQRRIIDHP